MFRKRESEDVNKLKKDLTRMGYNQINSALQYYSLACSEQITPSFKGDKELIEKIIKVIASNNSEKPFCEQFAFAHQLYIDMEIESRNDEYSFLNDLNVCLANPVIAENFASFKDIYLLFENKMLVNSILDSIAKINDRTKRTKQWIYRIKQIGYKQIVNALLAGFTEDDGENQIKLLIYYLKQARKYYADERAFYSAFISILSEDITEDTVNNHLLEAKMNTGIYDDEAIVALHGEVVSLRSQLSELEDEVKLLMLENEKIRKSNEELKRDYKELLEDIKKILQEEPANIESLEIDQVSLMLRPSYKWRRQSSEPAMIIATRKQKRKKQWVNRFFN